MMIAARWLWLHYPSNKALLCFLQHAVWEDFRDWMSSVSGRGERGAEAEHRRQSLNIYMIFAFSYEPPLENKQDHNKNKPLLINGQSK